MPKKKLDDNEYCIFLGQKLLGEPITAAVTRTSPGKYQLTLTFNFSAEKEHNPAPGANNDIPPNASYAVFKAGVGGPLGHLDGSVQLTYLAEASSPTSPDEVFLRMDFKTTGVKGNHG